MSVSGFVYSELHFFEWIVVLQEPKTRACGLRGGGCIENRALDCSEIPALSLSPAV